MIQSITAVIPTISPQRSKDVLALHDNLVSIGINCVVIANSASSAAHCRMHEIPHLDSCENLGFGGAINAVVSTRASANWVLLLNDDITLNLWEFRAAIDSFRGETRPVIIFLDPEPWRKIPRTWGAFVTLSLLGGIFRQGRVPDSQTARYKSFSAVAISASAWDLVGGFDTSMKFNFEDSDFVRRALRRGVKLESIEESGVAHQHSATGRRYIDAVLPVSAWSTRAYLESLGKSRAAATGLCALALIVRAPLSLLVSGSRRAHLRGIARALRALLTGQEPSLPNYESL